MNKQELIKELKEEKRKIEWKEDKYELHNAASGGKERAYSLAIDLAKELDEPKKVVVPPMIAKFIRESDDPIYEICTWADYYGSDGRTCEDSELSAVINWYGKNSNEFYQAVINGYEVKEEQLYWAVRGVTDYFRCDEKIIVFKKEEEALEVANLIGINTEVKKMNSIDCSECISIEELRNENEEPLFYVALPKIGDTEFCYLWTDTDGAVYTQGNKGLCIGRLKHTEQEIKSIDERYWPFAMKVDGE
ncbi:DUF1642 domain-containing protein [Enterococcus faecalis]|nr:DUF1642 domain-containing protein [Enterococcus faecalis]